MRLSNLLSLWFISNFIFSSFAQEDKLVKKGDAYFEQKNIPAALEQYELAYQQNTDNAYINLMLAKCYLAYYPKEKSLQYAGVAVRKSEKVTNEMYFIYAQALHINHRWDSASYYYLKSDPAKSNFKTISKLVQECATGKQLYQSPKAYKVTNAGPLVNSQEADYLPYVTADLSKLYFTSRRSGSTGGKVDADNQPFEDIYSCNNVGGAWTKALNMGSPLNTDIHDACVGISEDGQTMFVYKGMNGGDIYTSELKGNKWSTPTPLPFNTEFFESSACLSPDERTLYFVRATNAWSNRDIYMCSRTVGGNWSKPIKLPINTEYDEDAPFMHPDGKTLYFSSKGHNSMGGYDIFKVTKLASGAWSKPENMGAPLNTAGDDVYFVLSADGKRGFYSSNKEGGYGRQDIYTILMPIEQKAPELTLVKGVVKDATSGKPVEATITVTDNVSKEVIAKYKSNSETGQYLMSLPAGENYAITIEKPGVLFYSENIDLKNGYKEVKQDITLVPATAGSKIVLRNIFFDTGKYTIRSESYVELNKLVTLLKTNPNLRVEISGHTDNVGDENLNIQLSESRAKEVVQYLVSQGIAAQRLQSKGYGSSQPIAPNTTEEGKQKNRRTEFKVL